VIVARNQRLRRRDAITIAASMHAIAAPRPSRASTTDHAHPPADGSLGTTQVFDVGSQLSPGAQSSLVAQTTLHWPSPPQRNGAHATRVPSGFTCVTASAHIDVPAIVGTHVDVGVEHEKPLAQSAFVEHFVRHPLIEQTYAPHDWDVAALQLAPSHAAGGVYVVPAHVEVAGAQAVRLPCGAPITGAHCPSKPFTSHA
jgi:hypothetical protein